RQIPPYHDHKEAYRQHVIETEAERRGINPDTIRKARQFASAAGYTRQEMRELCALIERVQPDQPPEKAIVGKTHVLRLLTVKPKSVRRMVQRETVEQGWSLAELDAELMKRFGPRRQAGRRRRIPSETADVMTQAEGMCETWRRWRDNLLGSPEEDI